MNIGDRVKKIREDSGLNQTDFAEKIGVKQSFISKVEKEIAQLTIDHCILIATIFKVDLNWLLMGEEQAGTSGVVLPQVDRDAERIGKRILKLTGKRRNRVHDVLEDQEKLEDRAIVPTHVLAKEGAFITLNLLFCIYTTFAAPLAFVGLGWLGGPIAWKMFFWVGFCWFPTLLVAGVNQKNRETSVKIMKHRFVSLVRFKSEKFGHG